MKIEKCKNKELITESEQFFDKDKNLNQIFVSPDGQFFLKINDSSFHCSTLGKQVELITREMLKSGGDSLKTKSEKTTTKKGK